MWGWLIALIGLDSINRKIDELSNKQREYPSQTIVDKKAFEEALRITRNRFIALIVVIVLVAFLFIFPDLAISILFFPLSIIKKIVGDNATLVTWSAYIYFIGLMCLPIWIYSKYLS